MREDVGMSGIGSLAIAETPLVVVDLETTGLHPNGDSIIEIGAVRIDPGREPTVVLDTLIDPGRRVSGTEIHGITDADVRGAPSFNDVAPVLLDALDGAVFAAYNVYFDVKFLQSELVASGRSEFPPHLCLMYMRPLLELGSRCSLNDACTSAGIGVMGAHVAANDALMAAGLWSQYRTRMKDLGITRFSDLASRKNYKFFNSFNTDPLRHRSRARVTPKSRRLEAEAPRPGNRSERLSEYWDALKVALADLELSASEVGYLKQKVRELKMSADDQRRLHARAFAGVLVKLSADETICDRDVELIQGVWDGLRELGWAPGEGPGRGARTLPISRTGLWAKVFGR